MAQHKAFRIKPTKRQVRFFSESFKKSKVQEIDRNLTTVRMISKEYDVSHTAVEMYNNEKPHKSLRGLTPKQFENNNLKMIVKQPKNGQLYSGVYKL